MTDGDKRAKLIKVTEITNEGTTHPTQWDGVTDDSRPVYIRYRHGRVDVFVGEVGESADFDLLNSEYGYIDWYVAGHSPGELPYASLKEALAGSLELPEGQISSSRADLERQ